MGLRASWRNVLSGFWFLPGLVAAAHAVLAYALVQVDRAAGLEGAGPLFGGSSAGARLILSTIAGSIITVAGIAFSITIVSLQLVSQQFSPRATREFLADRVNQFAAGTFLGIFVYCLLVLRAIREDEFGDFLPSLATTVGITLGVVGLAVLLLFIHHMAQSIKVANIVARIASQTLGAIDDLYPEAYGQPQGERADEAAARWSEEHGEPTVVCASRPGYVQQIQLDELVERVSDGDEYVHVAVSPGEFVTERKALVRLWPARADSDPAERVGDAIVVDNERDVADDAAFGLQQLRDIALRAMSPSVNDPSTAITCLGYAAACVERLACRTFPDEVRRFGDRRALVAVHRPTFEDYVEEAFPDIGHYAAGDRRVVVQILRSLAAVAAAALHAGAHQRVEPLLEVADRVAGPAREQARTDADREAIDAALDEVRRVAGVPAAGAR